MNPLSYPLLSGLFLYLFKQEMMTRLIVFLNSVLFTIIVMDTRTSVTRLGNFWNFMAINYITKVAQMFGDFLVVVKTIAL